MILYLLIIGFISILGQVVILRELNVAFYGIELIYLLGIGIWLLGTAIGAIIGRRTFIPSTYHVLLLLVVFGLILLPDIAFIRSIRFLFAPAPGAYLPFFSQIGTMLVAILPVSVLLGLLFQWAAKQYVHPGKTLALAYAIESAGGLIGGLASTLLLKFGVQNFSIAILCCLVSLGSVLVHRDKKRTRYLPYGTILLIGLLLMIFWKTSVIDHGMTSWNHPRFVDTKDTPYSRVTVTSLKGQISVFENDALSFETEGTAAEEFVHLAALQHARPKEVLILGGGIEGISREILQHTPDKVYYVELNRPLIELVSHFLPENIQQSLKNERIELIIDDPRRFLLHENSFDLILVGMPEPTSGQSNRFYTEEFFEQCSARLNPDGVLAFRLRSAENLWSPQLTRRNISIYRALRSVFPEVVVLPGVTNIILASHSRLIRDTHILSERLEARNIEAKLVTPVYIHYLYTNDRYFQIQDTLTAGKAPINSDTRPICYQYAIAIWLSKFFPSLAVLDISLSGTRNDFSMVWYWIPIGIVLSLMLMSRFWKAFRRILLVGVAGFLGMVLETLFILNYQVKNGILFQDIGILLMAFMAGLTLGSLGVNKLAYLASGKYMISRWVGFCLLVGFGLLCFLYVWQIASVIVSGLLGTGCLLMITGFLVAGVFSYVSLRKVEDQRLVVSPLYSADLIGGCLGSLIGSIFLIPIIGLKGTSYIMAFLAMLSFLLL